MGVKRLRDQAIHLHMSCYPYMLGKGKKKVGKKLRRQVHEFAYKGEQTGMLMQYGRKRT